MKGIRAGGFTLLELLIVVVLIGILATVAIPQLSRSFEATRQAEARTVLGHLYQGEKAYFQEKNTYVAATSSSNPLAMDIPADASTENYFKYSVASADSTHFVATATRKVAADTGRSPAWGSAYTITVNETGTFTVGSF